MDKRRLCQRLWAETAAGRSRLRVPVRPLPPPPAPADSLERIGAEVLACRRCRLAEGRANAVPGEGPACARLMFVGEGPGEEEDREGRPFVGPAGKLLTRMIAAMGLAREDVYIANVVKCRPPGNRTPAPEEIAACREYLRRQIALVKPQVVIPLGNPATRWFLGAVVGITRVRGQPVDQGDFVVVPTFHPSYLLRSPEEKGKAWADLQVAMGLLGLPLPRTARTAPRDP